MKVRRKSLWRAKNAKLYRKRANQRAAKERLRAAREEAMPDLSHVVAPAVRPRGFRMTITCLEIGDPA